MLPEVDGGVVPSEAQFKAGDFTRNVLSMGKLFKGGYDIIVSHEYGTYVARGRKKVPI